MPSWWSTSNQDEPAPDWDALLAEAADALEASRREADALADSLALTGGLRSAAARITRHPADIALLKRCAAHLVQGMSEAQSLLDALGDAGVL